ncbi:hypothetical protein PUN28_005831 [Cardiocondyla obscurior]|uniref:Uncharacterized protein n=1 Tax=Cardiocondyla obscurior TaxID=286306 RepID=A0AAW2G876_9HYME
MPRVASLINGKSLFLFLSPPHVVPINCSPGFQLSLLLHFVSGFLMLKSILPAPLKYRRRFINRTKP